jgi:predicted transcriptional regulator
MSKTPYKTFLKTLSNVNRFEILNLLKQGPKNVSCICDELEMNQTTVSHHLSAMKDSCLVSVEINGKERVYSINRKTMKPLMDLIHAHMNEPCKCCEKEK